ncbi:hypothetical protein LQW54_010170 [Pestalotiopsis sp. IQ-011]
MSSVSTTTTPPTSSTGEASNDADTPAQTEQEQTGVNGITQLLRAIGSWGAPSGRGLHMFRSLMVASSTAAILGVSLAATLGLLTGSGSAGFLVGSCVGFVGASVAYHRLALAQAVVALRENPRLLQLHLAYNFPLAGFGGGAMTKAQLEAPYWRGSFHRQMLLIAAWQSASVQLDDVHEARTRAEVERIVRGEGWGLSLRRHDDRDGEHEVRIEVENRQEE